MNAPAEASSWRGRAAARPLHAWTRVQRDAFAALVGAAWESWIRAWALRWPGGEIGCAPATDEELARGDWTRLGSTPGGGAWVASPDQLEGRIARELFEVDQANTPIVRAVTGACRTDLLARTAAALRVEQCGPTVRPPSANAWSGCLIARGVDGVQVLADGAALAPLLEDVGRGQRVAHAGPRAAPVPLAHALAHRQVVLQVLLAGCEIDIGTLHALRPGDVVPTGHALTSAAQVLTAAGVHVFSAHLVRSGRLRAIELAATAVVNGEEKS